MPSRILRVFIAPWAPDKNGGENATPARSTAVCAPSLWGMTRLPQMEEALHSAPFAIPHLAPRRRTDASSGWAGRVRHTAMHPYKRMPPVIPTRVPAGISPGYLRAVNAIVRVQRVSPASIQVAQAACRAGAQDVSGELLHVPRVRAPASSGGVDRIAVCFKQISGFGLCSARLSETGATKRRPIGAGQRSLWVVS